MTDRLKTTFKDWMFGSVPSASVEQINSGEVTTTISANVTIPGGGYDLHFDDDKEADAYRDDPDGYAARYFGLSVEDYREWVFSNGQPMCGAVTGLGTLCKNPVHGSDYCGDAAKWTAIGKTIHRHGYCGIHAKLEEIAR